MNPLPSCGCVKKKSDLFRCAGCGLMFCAAHIYKRVDESNAAITKRARYYCDGCYRKKYE